MRLILCFVLLINCVMADCDWSKIEKKDNVYLYTPELHKCVGALVEKEKLYKQETEALNKSLELKDLAIKKVEDRSEMWREKTFILEDKYNQQQKYKDYRDWVFFGVGVLATGMSVWLAGQVYKN